MTDQSRHFDQYVLLADDSALPAIARWLEAVDEDIQASVYIEIAGAGDRQPLQHGEGVQLYWLERNGFDAASSTLLEDVLRDHEPEDGETFYWIAADARRTQLMQQFLLEYLQVQPEAIRTGIHTQDHAE